MLEAQDGNSPVDTHSLLLSLAGMVDDELLGWSRELAAVGESDYALELLTASVAADRVRLPEAVHADLREARRAQPTLELPAPDPEPVMAHRFLADPAAAGYPAAVAENFPFAALDTLPERLLRDCRLWLTWRLTPAGAAPAPVPHPVLLIETADHDGADLLAYQVADLLWQAGVFASVEVFGADTRLGDYHRAALDAAHLLDASDGSGPAAAASASPASASPAAVASQTGSSVAGVSSSLADEPAPTPPHGNPAVAREPAPRAPLRPVDRVITARAATALGSSPDNVMPFERPAPERSPTDPNADRRGRFDPFDQRQDGAERGAERGVAERGAERGVAGRGAERPARENGRPPWEAHRPEARDQRPRPRDESPPGPSGQPSGMFGPGEWQPPARPGPPRGAPERRPAQGRPPERNGAGGNAPGRNSSGGPDRYSSPPMPQLPMKPSAANQPTGRQLPLKPPMQPPPARPPVRPAEVPDLPDGLSDVEQRLLRQLHKELAAREDNGLPLADQPPQRMFRNPNGGGRPPRRPMEPPPDNPI